MADRTPESDFSIECFQNYSAPEVFVQGLAGVVNQKDIQSMILAQKNMLQRFEKTNEMLTNCNALSENRLKAASLEFKKHTDVLVDMRKDLQIIFKKIRNIKTKLSNQYPDAYKMAVTTALQNIKQTNEDDDEHLERPTEQPRIPNTVSTETLRPAGESSKASVECVRRIDEKCNDAKRISNSSTETETDTSSGNTSTDTG